MATRSEIIAQLYPNEPKFRIKQIEQGLFNWDLEHWGEFSFLPQNMRAEAEKSIPFMTVKEEIIQASSKKDTYKAKIEVSEGKYVETVMMQNKRNQWTICVSSQIGCAMACTFCATGKMGLTRNLNSDEIIDQYRFWNYFLKKHPELNQRISNMVFMGMGEPLANYPNVKTAINTLLKYSDLGPTKITVSTVGVIPALNKILVDPEWPHVRLAISLHSADVDTRKNLVPTSFEKFIPEIKEWACKYLEKYGNKTHHLTFEYVMLKDRNDTDMHAQKLADLVNSIGHVKVNLIPYNFTGTEMESSTDNRIKTFMKILENNCVKVTRRKNMGTDIDAACGQLITKTNK